MKKVILLASVLVGLFISKPTQAQYCGSSGTSICTANSSFTTEGFEPPEDSLPCIVDGVLYSQVIQVHTPASVTAAGSSYPLESIKIDTISNLPCGMCWALGNSALTIAGNATGCLKLSGTTYDAPGQYLLHIIVNATVSLGGVAITEDNQNLSSQGLKYFVRVQLPGGTCVLVDTLGASLSPSPHGTLAAPTISGNTSFCNGSSTTLSASGTNIYAYAWSNGVFTAANTVSSPGTYTVTVYGECTSATASKTITLFPEPRDTVTAAGPTSFCPGGSVALSVPAGSTSYLWSTAATTNSITATAAGTYKVTVTNSSGCSAVSSGVTVTIDALPSDTVTASPSPAICPGGSTTLSGAAGLTYHWSNGSTTQSISVTQAGTFTLTVTNSNNCTAVSSTITTTMATLPDDTIKAASATSFCPGGSVILSGAAGLTYHWSTGATTQNITATLAGAYTLTVTNANNCTAVSAATNVAIYALPDDTITAGGPVAFCPGGSVTLTAATGLTYHWSNGSTVQSISATTGGSYTLTVTNSNSCIAVSTPVTVTINALPDDTITAGGTTSFCPGGSVILSGKAGLTYNWSTGATTQSITATQAGPYTLTVTNSNNCTAVSAATTITVYALPDDTITAGGPLAFCPGGSVTLTGIAGLTYHWSTGATTQSISATLAASYTLTVTNSNNCSAASAPVAVSIYGLPDDTITAGSTTSFCPGGSVSLSGATGLTYHWSTGATTQSITATLAGPYTLTVTNTNNCSAVSAATNVTVYGLPNDTITAGGPLAFCPGGSVTLSGATGLTYHWSNGTTTQSISATQAGSYTLTVTNGNNCSAVSIPAAVTIYALPNDTVTAGGPVTFCSGGSVLLSAAAGLTYSWSTGATTQSITATQATGYTVTVTNSNQCSAVSSATVVSFNAPTIISIQPLSQVTCINGAITFSVSASGDNITYQWQKNGVNISGQQSSSYNITQAVSADTGNYRVIVSGICGNDTSTVATLQVTGSLTFSQQPVSQSACIGNSVSFSVVANGANTSFQWQKSGVPIATATSATYTISNVNTTDTGAYSCYVTSNCGNATSTAGVLTVNQPAASGYSVAICSGTTYNFNGLIVSSAGTYYDTLNTQLGCDSVVTLQLSLLPTSTGSVTASICPGGVYNYNGLHLTAPGTYLDTLTGSNSCDSIVTIHITLNQPSFSQVSATICSNGTYSFNGHILTHAGNYNDTLTNALGCDSIVTLTLTVNPVLTSNFSTSICAGSTYNFNGRTLTQSGSYHDTLQTVLGCDSIVTVTLTVNPAVTSSTNASICAGGSYNFNGTTLIHAGSYNDTLHTVTGCDSIVTVAVTVNPAVTSGFTAAICAGGSYNFNGTSVNHAGNFNDTLHTVTGCDSIVTLHLSVNQASGSTISASLCAGGTYTFGNNTLSASGTYYDTLSTAQGCDSIITLSLIVNPPIGSTIHASICANSSYSFNGQQITTGGTYTEQLTAQNGCDSTVTLVLQVNSFVNTAITAAICTGSTYNFNGHILTAAGAYTDTLLAAGGCDSIVNLSLTVLQPSGSNIQATICSSSSYNFNGRQLTASGTYRDTLTGSNTCDSIVTLTLLVTSYDLTNINGAICRGGSYIFNGRSLSVGGLYYDTLTAQSGCDSIILLYLVVNQPTSSSINATICTGGSYSFNGQQITTAGTYTETLTNSHGCDSVVTLTLSLNSFVTGSATANICPGATYNFNGRVLNTTGIYTDTLTALAGCDSIVTLNLTVRTTSTQNIQGVFCAGGSYNFYGHQLNAAGTYADTLNTQYGCDSIIILSLTETPAVGSTTSATICSGGSYNFNGRTLTSAGVYADTLSSQLGCDSIVTLTLGVGNGYNIQLHESICEGSSYNFNNQFLAISGTYVDTLTTAGGCDSITTLFLTVIPSPVITWNQGDTICDNNNATQFTLAAPSPAGGILSGAGLNGLVLTVNSSGTYPVTYTYVAGDGCSNTVTKNIVVESCLSLATITAETEISIYPNPTSDVLIAESAALANLHNAPVVYDITGKQITVTFTQQADKITFNTGSLAAGVYLVKFNFSGTVITKRFVKAE
jgi:hypothetical protein